VRRVLPSQRDLFDIPDGLAYLNCAYMSPQLNAVREAARRAVDLQSHPWEVGVDDFFAPSERLRELFASLIGGDSDGVALIPAVSYGVGIAAANLPVGAGRTVVMVAEQFPSNVYPWRESVQQSGGDLVVVPKPEQGDWTAPVLAAIDRRTAVVAVPQVHWTDGRRLDLEAVGRAARGAGAALVVDATQSLGAAPFNLAAIRPDFVVATGYKWLLGPYSLGYLWVAPEHRLGNPLEFNWITRKDAEDFAGLVDYRDTYQDGARRFDVGERSNFTLTPMGIAALEQLAAWTPDAVAATIEPLTGRIEEGSRDLGLDPVPAASRESHLMGVRLPRGTPGGLADALAAADVHVSIRGDSVRISPHVYNTVEDVDRLLEVLAATLG
jgi:selenocysteine lyase/cysteine desulfurase